MTCAATSWGLFSTWAKRGVSEERLPGGFAPWQTVYYYFRTWKQRGAVARLLSIARRGARREAGREPEPSAVIIDCQSVPITRSGSLCGFDGNKKVKGRKRHILTDTQGWTWAVGIRAANEPESQHAFELIEQADQRSVRLEVVFADKAYRGDLEGNLEEALGLQLETATSASDEPGFSVEPKRWIVERTLGWWGGWLGRPTLQAGAEPPCAHRPVSFSWSVVTVRISRSYASRYSANACRPLCPPSSIRTSSLSAADVSS